jgi:hypothetical protein
MTAIEIRQLQKTFQTKRKAAGLRRYESGSSIQVEV